LRYFVDYTSVTRENILRMVALKERLPELIIVPAHDMRAFGEIANSISDDQRSRASGHRDREMRKDGRLIKQIAPMMLLP
jgi:hypothetical protein